MTEQELKKVVEVALLVADEPLSVDGLLALFEGCEWQPDRPQIRRALEALARDCEPRGIELAEVASGFRLQVRRELAPWVGRLWAERPPRYSRALLETLALIAYRQPITRGEIEEVRGVGVSTSMMKTLLDREWVRVLGHREVPGRPAMYGTTRTFLDDFGLEALEDLPPLAELRDLENMNADLFSDADGQTLAEPAAPVGADAPAATQPPPEVPGDDSGPTG